MRISVRLASEKVQRTLKLEARHSLTQNESVADNGGPDTDERSMDALLELHSNLQSSSVR